MVSAARKDARREREPLERRNEQLQAQLNDAELLLASHQEQLAELKLAMQDMTVHRNELETSTNASTAPSTPSHENQDHMSKIFDALNLSPTTPGGDEIAPAPPTSFTHLLQPVLRTDLQAYEDFHALLDIARKSQPSSRVTSGNYGGLSGLGLGNLTHRDHSNPPDRMPSNGSTSSLSASNIQQSSSGTPNLSTSTNSSFSSRDASVTGTLLKETSFYKRALTEDIEPTLRLDTSPGLSWLARRNVINSMCEGRLIVEPTPSTARLYHPPCTLCGEQGRSDKHARTHQFRTSESETAQRYPLCKYCLNRVRATCDFLGFLRMVKDGHWRTQGAHAEAVAWEESVRLRERMFWSRIGGGVIPAFLRVREDTPRSSTSTEDDKIDANIANPRNSSGTRDTRPEGPSPLAEAARPKPAGVDTEFFPPSPSHSVQDPRTEECTLLPPSGKGRSVENPNQSQNSDTRVSLSRTSTRPRGLSRADSSGWVARRAAMFERSSEDAASKQLQSSQEAGRIESSLNGKSHLQQLKSPGLVQSKKTASGSIPGSFDF